MKQLGLAIHAAMLADEARTRALEAAVAALVRPGDVVVDVGAGTGLLSMMAVRAGARRAYAVEAGSMAGVARALVARNGMADRIEVVQELSTACALPELADVVLSETLGFAGLDERIRPALCDARDRLAKPGARLLPREVELWLAPVGADLAAPELGHLDRVAGFDFGLLAPMFARLVQRRYVDPALELAPPMRAVTVDFERCAAGEPIEATLSFPRVSAPVHGFILWFDAELAPGIRLSSREHSPRNHWGQAYLALSEPVAPGPVELLLSVDDLGRGFRLEWSAARGRCEAAAEGERAW